MIYTIKEVSTTIFMLILALLLFKFIFIDGKPHMWEAIDSATRANWSMYTLRDGKDIDDELGKVLESTADLTTR